MSLPGAMESRGDRPVIIVRGLAAALVLAVTVVGVPWLLLRIGHLPDPSSWSRRGFVALWSRPGNGEILLILITVVAWLAWLVVTVAVLTELAGTLASVRTGRRVRLRLPGLHAPQLMASTLIIAVVAMVAGSLHAAATPRDDGPSTPGHDRSATRQHAEGQHGGGHTAGTAASRRPARANSATRPDAAEVLHYTVQPGDDLWSLAERFYHDGAQWRTIAAANQDLLTGGPDELIVGWRLRIPDPVRTRPASVVVRPGDTLTGLAQRYYDDPARWKAIAAANPDVIDDPDLLRPGWRLTLPDTTDPSEADAAERTTARGTPTAPHTTAPAGAPTNDDERSDAARPQTEQPQTEQPQTEQPQTEQPQTEQPDRDHSDAGEPDHGRSGAGPAVPRPSAPPTPERTGRAPAPAGEPPPSHSATPAATPASTTPSRGSAAGVAALGGLLGATLVGGLAARRQRQLLHRPVGRRIPHPGPAAQRLETHLAQTATPSRREAMTPDDLDLALRGLAHRSTVHAAPLPRLTWATMDPAGIELRFAGEPGEPPIGFAATPEGWRIDRQGLDYLRTVPGIATAPCPWPAVCCVGDSAGGRVLVDLEHAGLLGVEAGPDRTDEPGWGSAQDAAWGSVLAGMVLDLSLAPWTEGLRTVVVGHPGEDPPDWLEALGLHSVTWSTDTERTLDRLAARVRDQRAVTQTGAAASPAERRVDSATAAAWDPELVVFTHPLPEPAAHRLTQTLAAPGTAAAIAIAPAQRPAPDWRLLLGEGGGAPGRLDPVGVALTPVRVPADLHDDVVDLVGTTGRTDTLPAPWWQGDVERVLEYVPRRAHGGGLVDEDRLPARRVDAPPVGELPEVHVPEVVLPEVQLLGPISLVGTAGPPPSRALRQCVEYCAWLLEHPGATAAAMADSLCVAETTRRSNMSRLRSWLGEGEDGRPYLPDAYSGRIRLDPVVSSDWHRLQLLISTGIDRSRTSALVQALTLVRGAPLADAAPGQWQWAEELRTDMVSTVRDLGVELARRATRAGDLDLARWAAARALVAAPGDELLMGERIRTEHRAGRQDEVERLIRQVQSRARSLESDLQEETIVLMQIALEGRTRARHP